MSKRNILCLVLLVFFQRSLAGEKSDSLVVHLDIKFGKEMLELDKNYISKNNETLQITALKFYVSGIQIQFSDGSVATSNEYHLVNLEKPETGNIAVCPISKKEVVSVAFNVGVDSLAFGIQQHFQRGQGWRDPIDQGVRVGLLKLISRINLDAVDGDRFAGWADEPESLRAVTLVIAADRAGVKPAGHRVRVVLKHDHAGQRVSWIEPDDGALG